ncbi:hypothetical protein Nepgr_026353 [Nepenthes gracilis]|uniref:FAS1 domain-containing protein n=1 Tax=Nepenthes gracilis TaxID=150966 RepID=A0AAD3Y1Y6_NEPGR|nr:hypothetical protein Nepgr_026353 [Nepenthes gracilis]
MDTRSKHYVRLLLAVTLSLLVSHTLAEIPFQEVEAAVEALRSEGYRLFGNSIAVSDILYQIISGDNFTLLSPPDSALFSLDMSTNAFHYVFALRFHVIPRRLSATDLRYLSLSGTPYIETLVPQQSLFVSYRRREIEVAFNVTVFEFVEVDGVRISSPDVYLGTHIAAHGIDGALAAGLSKPENGYGDLGFVSPSVWPQGSSSPSPRSERENNAMAPLRDQNSPESSGGILTWPFQTWPDSMSPADINGDTGFASPSISPSLSTGFVPDFTTLASLPVEVFSPSIVGIPMAPQSFPNSTSPDLSPPESAINTSLPGLELGGVTPVYYSPALSDLESDTFTSSPRFEPDSISIVQYWPTVSSPESGLLINSGRLEPEKIDIVDSSPSTSSPDSANFFVASPQVVSDSITPHGLLQVWTCPPEISQISSPLNTKEDPVQSLTIGDITNISGPRGHADGLGKEYQGGVQENSSLERERQMNLPGFEPELITPVSFRRSESTLPEIPEDSSPWNSRTELVRESIPPSPQLTEIRGSTHWNKSKKKPWSSHEDIKRESGGKELEKDVSQYAAEDDKFGDVDSLTGIAV